MAIYKNAQIVLKAVVRLLVIAPPANDQDEIAAATAPDTMIGATVRFIRPNPDTCSTKRWVLADGEIVAVDNVFDEITVRVWRWSRDQYWLATDYHVYRDQIVAYLWDEMNVAANQTAEAV